MGEVSRDAGGTPGVPRELSMLSNVLVGARGSESKLLEPFWNQMLGHK